MPKRRVKLLLRPLNKHRVQLATLPLPEAREYFEKLCDFKYKPRIKSVINETIRASGTDLKLRVYKGKSYEQGTIIYFHGGGFALGSIESHEILARLLCKFSRCTIISVNYRLAPEYPYPAAVEDSLVAYDWVKSQTNLNTDNVLLAGDSAGGQIALYAAMELHGKLKGLILIYPSVDPTMSSDSMQEFQEGHFVTKIDAEEFWRLYLDKQKLTWPIAQSELKKLPPTILLSAFYDILRDEGKLLADDIQKAGVDVEYHCYPDTIHGFMQMPPVTRQRNKAFQTIARFVSKLSL